MGKSHEELVLMLIHLRRQSVALNEAIDATKAELGAAAEAESNNNDDAMDENKRMLAELQVGFQIESCTVQIVYAHVEN